jgi:beta-lactamase superfamily II metal-dependent hydrolase
MRPYVPLHAGTASCLVLILAVCLAGCTGIPGTGAGIPLQGNATGDLKAYFLDVGQGDASLILFRDKVILIDAGEIDQGDRVVSDLRRLGVAKIDLLVATHPHSDHIGGMQKVLAAFPVGKVLDSGIPSTSSLYEHFLETIDKKNIPYVVAVQGQTIDVDPTLRVLVLSPPRPQLDTDLNGNSIILKVSYGTTDLLYTGDAGDAAERALLKTGYSPAAQVLKVSHHGSSDATSKAFLARVNPEVAIISLGSDNPYGHPHKETLSLLQESVPTIYRTDKDGTVLVQSDGVRYSVSTENGQGNIWSGSMAPSTASSPAATPAAATASPSHSAPVTLPTIPPLPSNVTVPVPSLTLPPVQLGDAANVKISAVRFNAPGDDRQNLNGEWVRLTNRGDGPVLIAGWSLTDQSGKDPYLFPAIVMLPEESVTVYVGSGTMNATSVFMGRTEPLFGNSGDTAILKDGSGTVIDQRSA